MKLKPLYKKLLMNLKSITLHQNSSLKMQLKNSLNRINNPKQKSLRQIIKYKRDKNMNSF